MTKKKRKFGKLAQAAYSEDRSKSSGKKGFMKWKGDVKFFDPSDTQGNSKWHRFDVIPYVIKNEKHPLVAQGKAEIGQLDMRFDVFVHRYAGANGEDIVCLKKNYGKPCPVCTRVSELYESGDEEEGKKLVSKPRTLMNIRRFRKGEAMGMEVYNTSFNNFAKGLLEVASACEDGKDIIDFADPDDGKMIKAMMVEEQFGKNPFYKLENISFEDRRIEVTDEEIESAISFDELLIVYTYDEIEAILHGQGIGDDDEEEQEDEKHSAKAVIPEDDSTDVFANEGQGEEEKQPSPKKNTSNDKCPYGHTFGEDVDATVDCGDCEVWDDCMEAS